MARPFRKAQKAKVLKQIGDLYLIERISQSDVAQRVKVSISTVSRYLGELAEQWKKDALFDFDEAKRKELQRINRLELEYHQAWKKSIGKKKITTTKETKDN